MNTNDMKMETMEMTMKEMELVAGGHPFEECFGDISLYRAGVSYVNVTLGYDEYYVGDREISKDLAKELRERSKTLWKNSYSESGDYVAYAKEWKGILANDYGISWNGLMGTYRYSFN
ncbi:MAG: hypothetical protein IJ174_08720 [Clostridia bacterium]|nr:hypothetical protein [Clostridia bacterium]